LASRRPSPPSDLAAAIAFGATPGALEDILAAEGVTRLDAARSQLGRVRESAFRLLEADALITYACEAALDCEDPEGALRRILVTTGI
jgi:hypothetical protein